MAMRGPAEMSGVSLQQARDAIRWRARWRPVELAFWIGAAVVYFLFPAHLVLLTQILISGLFAMSLWVEGESYYAFGNSPMRRVPVPTLPTRNLPANPHYLVILTILFRGQERGKEEKTLMPKETLFNETKVWQVPVRNADEEIPPQELTPLAFSRLIAALMRWNLIREESNPDNDGEKLYSITPDGELALFVYSARMKKRGVASTPGLS